MSELPMTAAQFFEIFRAYNEAVWPAPVLWVVLSAAAVFAAFRRSAVSDRAIALFLGALWLWSGVAYMILRHAPHNPIGYVFGGLFVLQALLFVTFGAVRREITFVPRRDSFGLVGGFLLFYALVAYPIVGYVLGQRYPWAPTFGVPCPTTIFTFGMLLWTTGRIRWQLLVVPVLWAFIAVGAALGWGVYEDGMMPVAAAVATVMLIRRNRRNLDSVSAASSWPAHAESGSGRPPPAVKTVAIHGTRSTGLGCTGDQAGVRR